MSGAVATSLWAFPKHLLTKLLIGSIIGQQFRTFGTAWVCKSTFLCVKFTKSKYRSRMSIKKLASQWRKAMVVKILFLCIYFFTSIKFSWLQCPFSKLKLNPVSLSSLSFFLPNSFDCSVLLPFWIHFRISSSIQRSDSRTQVSVLSLICSNFSSTPTLVILRL